MIRWLLFALMYATTVAAQSTALERLNRLLADDFFQRATVGVAVYDLTEQKTLFVHNEKRLCRPASNMKLLTSAAALSVLTPEYSFKTGVYHTGYVNDSGRLLGDVYLVGGFDPELKSADLDKLIVQIKNAGIRSIEGSLYLDATMADTIHWGKAWSWDDDMEAFQPYLSPIPLNKGVVRLRVAPTATGSAPTVRTEPVSSFIQVENRATTVARSAEPPRTTLRFSRDFVDRRNLITVSGTIPASANAYETFITLKNPRGYALTIFAEKMSEQFPGSNISVAGTMRVPANAQNLGYVANSMIDVLKPLNKDSDNLNAEMFLYALGYQQDGEPSSTEKGIAVVQQFMEQIGYPSTAYRMVDGSGLSNQNYLTPEMMVDVLKYMYRSPHFEPFRQSLPIAGVDGTLINRMRNTAAHRRVTAKTGSLTSVSALSGYATARNGNILAFSIMIQNFVERTANVAVNYVDRICVAISEF